MASVRILAGDIGGTNARLVLYEADASLDFSDVNTLKKHRIVSQRNFKNNDFASFTDVLSAFLESDNAAIDACCFAVAGPVVNNRINFTNRDGWILDSAAIEAEFPIERVKLVNDFVASGHGVMSLTEDDLITLQRGKLRPDGPVALVGAGTGLGECYVAKSLNANLPIAYPSEGGHVEFAPRSAIEDDLLRFLQERFSEDATEKVETDKGPMPINEALMKERTRVSVERVLSGRGLENIYEFLRATYPDQVVRNYDEQYNESLERGRLIGKHHWNYTLFHKALEIMFGIYGSEVGNVALKYLPYGGLYIAGGIAPKNVEFMTEHNSLFMHRFRQKGRLSSIMPDIPVHVVMKEDLGIRGAHIVASRIVEEVRPKNMEANDGRQTSADGFAYGFGDRRGIPMGYVPAKPDTLRYAVSDYPMTYAWLIGVTAVATASFMTAGALVLGKKK